MRAFFGVFFFVRLRALHHLAGALACIGELFAACCVTGITGACLFRLVHSCSWSHPKTPAFLCVRLPRASCVFPRPLRLRCHTHCRVAGRLHGCVRAFRVCSAPHFFFFSFPLFSPLLFFGFFVFLRLLFMWRYCGAVCHGPSGVHAGRWSHCPDIGQLQWSHRCRDYPTGPWRGHEHGRCTLFWGKIGLAA